MHNWYGSTGTIVSDSQAWSNWYVAGRPALGQAEKTARATRLRELRRAMGDISQERFAELSRVFNRTEVNRLERGREYALSSNRQIQGIATASGLSFGEAHEYILGARSLDSVRPKLTLPGTPAPTEARWWMTVPLRHHALAPVLQLLDQEGVEEGFLRALIRDANESPERRQSTAWKAYARRRLPGWRERSKVGLRVRDWNRRKRDAKVNPVVLLAVESAYAVGETPLRAWEDVVARYGRVYRQIRARVEPALRAQITPLDVAREAGPYSEVA